MSDLVSRDVEYSHDGTRMLGYLCAPAGASALPSLVLVHDAFGVSEDMIVFARRYAELGYTVLLADVWGERTVPTDDGQIGPLIGGMAGDRDRWIGRVAAAHETLAAQPEADAAAIASVGYCFGGSSALEYLRSGGSTRGVVSIHGGLDLLAHDWDASVSPAKVLLCTGADDPMATAGMRDELVAALDAAGLDWELDLYSGTKHAFTNPKSAFSPMPEVVAYNARSAARAWESTTRFLDELFTNP